MLFHTFSSDIVTMKYSHFLSTLSLLVLTTSASADISFAPMGQNGIPSHIDTTDISKTIIHYKTTSSTPGNVKLNFSCPAKNAQGVRPHNHFLLERSFVENGQTKTRIEPRHIAQGSSCETIRTQDPTITNCNGQTTLSVGFKEKDSSVSRGPEKVEAFRFDISNPEVKKQFEDQLKECSGDHGVIVFHDPQGKGLSANTLLKTNCNLPKQRISLPSAVWDDNSFKRSHIHTSNGGVMIGDHTHIYFDERRDGGKGMFCYHFKPDNGNASTVCKKEFGNGMTFPLDFLHGNKNINRGVFRIGKDAKGKPIIEVGASNNPNPPANVPRNKIQHQIDRSKPFVRATIDINPKGKTITYESFSKENSPLRTLHMHPQYRMPTEMKKDSQSCDPNSCTLRAGDQSQMSCQKRDPVFMMSANKTPLCYTCNGVGAGTCSSEKKFLDDELLKSIHSQLNSCMGLASPAQPQATPTTPTGNAEIPPDTDGGDEEEIGQP